MNSVAEWILEPQASKPDLEDGCPLKLSLLLILALPVRPAPRMGKRDARICLG